jgi:hypothetical protein
MYGIELLVNNDFRQRSGEEDIMLRLNTLLQ